jgi:hypothetical protein
MTREELIEKINECVNMFDEIYKWSPHMRG